MAAPTSLRSSVICEKSKGGKDSAPGHSWHPSGQHSVHNSSRLGDSIVVYCSRQARMCHPAKTIQVTRARADLYNVSLSLNSCSAPLVVAVSSHASAVPSGLQGLTNPNCFALGGHGRAWLAAWYLQSPPRFLRLEMCTQRLSQGGKATYNQLNRELSRVDDGTSQAL